MNCQGLGRLFGHHYVGSYSKVEASEPVKLAIISAMGDVFARDGKHDIVLDRTYHGHVCTRCGNVVNKQEVA